MSTSSAILISMTNTHPLRETSIDAAATHPVHVLDALTGPDSARWLRTRLRLIYQPVQQDTVDGRTVWTVRHGHVTVTPRAGETHVGLTVLTTVDRFVPYPAAHEAWVLSHTSMVDVLGRAATVPAAYVAAVLGSCLPELDDDVIAAAAAAAADTHGPGWDVHRFFATACMDCPCPADHDAGLRDLCRHIVEAAEK